MDLKKLIILLIIIGLGIFIVVKISSRVVEATPDVIDTYDRAKVSTLELSAKSEIQYFDRYFERKDNVCYEINRDFNSKIGAPYMNYNGSIIYDGTETYIWLSGNGYMTSGSRDNLTTIKSEEVITNCNK